MKTRTCVRVFCVCAVRVMERHFTTACTVTENFHTFVRSHHTQEFLSRIDLVAITRNIRRITATRNVFYLSCTTYNFDIRVVAICRFRLRFAVNVINNFTKNRITVRRLLERTLVCNRAQYGCLYHFDIRVGVVHNHFIFQPFPVYNK